MSAPSPSLRVDEVSHRFGSIIAAERICLEVGASEVHCLVGPSGSGKSTLLRLVAGLERLRQGRIEVGGTVVARGADGPEGALHRSPEERSVGLVFQDYALFPHLNVWRNVAFGLGRSRSGKGRRALRRAVEPWLERVGMAASAEAMPHTLSGGQQQRVALARALAPGPRVMLLDEPFSGLDERLRDEVRGFTLSLLREAGAATLMITHDPREALQAGDALSVIREGRLLQTGTPLEVYHRPVSVEVAEVLGPVNRIRVEGREGSWSTPWGPVVPGSVGASEQAADPGELLIRPDALELSRPGEPGEGRATGRVVAVHSGGTLQTVSVDLDGLVVDVYAFSRDAWTVGDTAVVRWVR